jgi:hypothetical protein
VIIGPQTNLCKTKAASTISEITLSVNNSSSTTSVQLQKRHCSTFSGGGSCTAFTHTNLLSAVLPAAAVANADACAKSSISQSLYRRHNFIGHGHGVHHGAGSWRLD